MTVVTTLALVALFHWVDAHEIWHTWIDAEADRIVDELPFAMAAACLAFAWFAYRRWQEQRASCLEAEALNRSLAEEATSRTHTKEALLESEARLKDFAEVSSDWFWEMDADLRFNAISGHYEEVTGISFADAVGKRRDEFASDRTDNEKWRAHLSDLEARRSFRNFEYEVVRRDNKIVYLTVSGMPVFDQAGVFKGYRGTGRDISQRKRAEARLRDSEERYRTLYNKTPVMLHSIDAEGRLLSVSDYWLRHLGYRREEVLGRKSTDFLTEASSRYAAEVIIPRFLKQGYCEGIEYQYVKKSGEVIDVLLSATTETAADGSILRSLAVLIDVTELKRSKAALESAKEEAEQANRAKTAFLANMSHELRTPLNAIIGFAEILRDQRFGPIGDPRYADFADEIDRAGQQLMTLITDLLDIAKIEAGKAELRQEAVEPEQIARACVAMVRGRAQAAQLTIEVELPPELPLIWVDSGKIKQILLNLLSNSLKFTDAGGRVTLTVDVTPEQELRLTVSDTGIGMSPEEIPLALERFGQIERHKQRGHDGSGLGLHLVKSLSELHGGSLEIESEPGRGTTASLILPAWRIQSRPEEESPTLNLAG